MTSTKMSILAGAVGFFGKKNLIYDFNPSGFISGVKYIGTKHSNILHNFLI